MTPGTRIGIRHITAGYGATHVVHHVDLGAEPGTLLALLGPSGCGKTTLLRVVAGLLKPEEGDILFDDVSVLPVAPEHRRIGMVFQKPLLFPHLTVLRNVEFGLKMQGVSPAERTKRAEAALDQVQMASFSQRRPKELSGGQEQRVALARALVTQPRVLLLDEPFSALDERLRSGMRSLLRGLQRELRVTTIFVTHDLSEAAEVSDRTALMLDGRIEQTGTTRDFYERPATPQAARFFGWQQWDDETWCRPEHIVLGGTRPAVVDEALDAGTHTIVRLRLDGRSIEAHMDPHAAAGLAQGQTVCIDNRNGSGWNRFTSS